MTKRILVIDNYDSFVYILAQYIGELGAEPIVIRNDEQTTEQLAAQQATGVLISPGPGEPSDSGISLETIEHFAGKIPIFGVCLGHQCIGEVFGSKIVRAPELMHGKTSSINHKGKGVFKGLQQPLQATRYHSLVIDPTTLSDDLEVTATSDTDLIMGVRHKTLDVEGVQFHPESVLTENGHQIIQNFLNRC